MNMALRGSHPDAQNLHRRNSYALVYRDTRELNQKVPGKLTGKCDDCLSNHPCAPSIKDNANMCHHKNQQVAQVTESHSQTCVAINYAQNRPSLRGEPWCLCGTKRPAQNRPEIIGPVESITRCNPVQLFGSIPRCCNSLRIIRLSQAEMVSSPSSLMACCIASSREGSTRKAICLFPLGILMFDMCLTLGLILIVSCNVYHVSDTCKALSPAVLPALTGPLTKPLIEVAVMADQQHTQTRPAINTNFFPQRFNWRFLALSVTESNIIHIIALSEREARDQSPSGCVMVFAGRLPVQEVHHA